MCDYERDRAVGRLSAARAERGRLDDEHGGVAASKGDLSAQSELRGAREEVTARERWLEWVDSDGEGGRESTPALEDLRAR